MTMLPGTKRIIAIDILRGIVMVVMALDHVRDFFSGFAYDPTDLQHAGTAMFLTRWVTHYCAPVFIFLSGTSAWLAARSSSTKDTSLRLLTRGLWLVVLEVTVVRFGWMFNLQYSLVILQVIWAIGISMVVLAGLVWLPRWAILAIALLMIGGHNALDGYHGSGWLWQLLHVQGPINYGYGRMLMVIYPLVPWVGVMAAGYCLGSVMAMEERQRNRILYTIGLGAIALFIVLRAINGYGDPEHWAVQGAWHHTILSFVNCTKYPPSLLYLLMTLGPAIAALPLLERWHGAVGRVMTVYGRVPLFYYVMHIYLIHSMALVVDAVLYPGEAVGVFQHPGYSLPVVHLCWLIAVAILYLPCRWYMRIKQNHRKWWLSYL